MKYKLYLEANFEADSYLHALSLATQAGEKVEAAGFTVTEVKFKEQHVPAVVIRDSGMTSA